MAARDNAYSRFVALARIVLPLAALALLSTIFLVSRGPDPQPGLSRPPTGMQDLAGDPRIGAPEYAGLTRDGTAMTLTADVIRPATGGTGPGTVAGLYLRLNLPDGSLADLSAGAGTLDLRAGQAELSGGVRITSSTGYRLHTERVTAALDQTDVASAGPVTGDGPAGRIRAGRVRLRADPVAPGRYVLVFKDGVTLVYDPGQ